MNIREKNIKVSTVISFLIPIIIWAMLAYLAKLNLSLAEEAYLYHTEGIVTRISSQVTNGNTTYYMIIGDDNTKLYVTSSSLSDEFAITREGDNVKVSYIDDSNGTVSISDFDNLDFSQVKSEDQVRKDDQIAENGGISENDTNTIIEVTPEDNEAEWNSLTDEEKAKLLQNNN